MRIFTHTAIAKYKKVLRGENPKLTGNNKLSMRSPLLKAPSIKYVVPPQTMCTCIASSQTAGENINKSECVASFTTNTPINSNIGARLPRAQAVN